MVKSRVFVRAQHFNGQPKESDFSLIEQDVDDNLCDGEILTEALCISPDPYIRIFPTPIGSEFRAFQVSKVLKSKNSDYPVGCRVLQECGWRTITKSKGDEIWYKCDDIPDGQSISVALGALGMPGVTAHYGLHDFIKPKKGETVMVTAAAGAVGSMVGQIAKIMGCRTVGCCGSDAKVEYLKSLGFDAVFNYKTQDWDKALKEAAPSGIDCFYDNVGGKIASTIIGHMNAGGRIGVCGCSSAYNELEPPQAPILQKMFFLKCLKMEGFLVFNHTNKQAAYDVLRGWIAEGKIKTRETVTNGFENLPRAFIDLLNGSFIGKAIVMM